MVGSPKHAASFVLGAYQEAEGGKGVYEPLVDDHKPITKRMRYWVELLHPAPSTIDALDSRFSLHPTLASIVRSAGSPQGGST